MHSGSPIFRAVGDLRVFEPQERLQRGVHIELIRLEVPVPDPRGARGLGHRIALLTFAERLLVILPIGEMDSRADVTDESAVRLEPRHAPAGNPTVDPVVSAK